MKLKYKYILFYIFLVVLFISYANYEKNQKIQEHLQLHTKEIQLEYKALYNEYKNLSHVIFLTDINRDEIIKIFQDAYKSDTDKKSLIREKLYKKLYTTYELLKQYNIKQLHFHLPNNESFLRFHRPKKYGDDLSNIRHTVAYVNQHKKPIDSFEEGRIYNGYRFVYPLFDTNSNHIGSVEISFSTQAFNEQYLKVFDMYTNFLIKKELVEGKVFQSERENYTQTVFSNYLIEKNNTLEYLKFSQNSIDIINTTNNVQSIYDKKANQTITILPVTNSLTKKVAGLFIANGDENHLINAKEHFYVTVSLFSSLVFFIFYFLYKSHLKKIKLDSIIKEANSGIGTIGLNGKFKSVNHVYCELLGYTEEELLNLSCLDLTYKEDIEASKLAFDTALKKGEISNVTKRCQTKSGELITLEMSLKKLPTNDELVIVINSLEDKLQLEKLNQNLQLEIDHAIEDIRHKDNILFQQSKTAAMGEMIDAIAHQWKTPLGIIRLYAQQVEYILENDNKINKKELQEYMKNTNDQVDHLIITIDEFRSFFRPKTNIEEVPLKAIIDSVLKLMKDELIKNTILTTIEGELTATVKVIPNEFKHVLINLINNSKDAFNEKSIKDRQITFIIKEEDDIVSLEFKDNAGGIPENIIDHIFEANITSKEEGKGTGIGLYLTKQIIEKFHGLVEVKNLNKGALFTIIFNPVD